MTSIKKLLLIEDEEAHAELILIAFEKVTDTEIVHVDSLARAKKAIADAEAPFDLVLADLRLTDGLGTDILEVFEEGSSSPVVIMTSQGDEKSAVAAMKAGAWDYVVKSEVIFRDLPRIAEHVLREVALVQKQKELEKALQSRNRLATIGTAAAVLAHEIGNPLNSMGLHAQLLKRRLTKSGLDEPRLFESLEACQADIQRLSGLLDEFRCLSREQKLSLKEVDVHEFSKAAAARYRPMMDEAKVVLNCTSRADLGAAVFDDDKMTQVILNLLKNASEAMSEGGVVEFETQRASDSILFKVTDSGCGVPEGMDIFEPFQSTKEQGSGLGLPIVREIVLAHGGTISCLPNVPTGAVFTVQLPISQRPERR